MNGSRSNLSLARPAYVNKLSIFNRIAGRDNPATSSGVQA